MSYSLEDMKQLEPGMEKLTGDMESEMGVGETADLLANGVDQEEDVPEH